VVSGEGLLKTSLLIIFLSLTCLAHLGVTYPLIEDQPTKFGKLSIWADPDVGKGEFIILLEPEKQNTEEITVNVKAGAFSVLASRDRSLEVRDPRRRFVAQIPFDHAGTWPVEFQLMDESVIVINVDVKEPGPSRREFLIYTLPFVLVGGLAITLFIKRRGLRHEKV
jgi:hypothetical protein